MSDIDKSTDIVQDVIIEPVYKNKNFVLLTLGSFVSGLGDNIHRMSLILFIITIAGEGNIFKSSSIFGTGTAVGIIVMISYIPGIFLGPFLGVLADRLDRRRIMITMDILRGIIAVTLGYLAYIDLASLWVLCAGTALLVSCSVLYFPATSALYPNLVHRTQLMKANSISSFVGSTTGLVGPAFAAFIYGQFGAPVAFAVNGVTFMFSAICETIMNTPKQKYSGKAGIADFFENLTGGFKFVLKTKALMAMLLFGLTVNFFFFPVQDVVRPIIIKTTLNLSDMDFGYISSLFIGGFAFSALMLNFLPKMEKKHKFLLWSMFGQAMGLILLVVPIFPFIIKNIQTGSFFIIYCTISVIRGIAFGFSNVPMRVVYQTLIPDEYRGRVYALQGTFFQAAKPIGVLLVGMLIDKYSSYIITTIAGIGMAIACLIMFRIKEIKEI